LTRVGAGRLAAFAVGAAFTGVIALAAGGDALMAGAAVIEADAMLAQASTVIAVILMVKRLIFLQQQEGRLCAGW
jgi:hypothetical protein